MPWFYLFFKALERDIVVVLGWRIHYEGHTFLGSSSTWLTDFDVNLVCDGWFMISKILKNGDILFLSMLQTHYVFFLAVKDIFYKF